MSTEVKDKKKKTQTNWILKYYQDIKSGKEIVGHWILLLYEYIIDGLQKKSFFYDGKKANLAIKWIEAYCHHSKGRNDNLILETWQKAFISLIFGIVDSEGLRQFREVVLVIGRKNGKSLLASSIIAYMNFMDGEFGPETYCLAPKIDQSNIVYSCFWQMTQMEEELKCRIKSRKSDLYIAENNGTIQKIAFSAKKSDGFNPHLIVCDEIAAWSGDQGLKVYEVMKSSLGSRKQPILLSITTSGYIHGSIYDELFNRGTRFLLGDSKEKRLLPVFYTIDELDKWNDLTELQKSNPNLGVSVSVDYMLEEIAIAEGSLSKKAEFLCKYCCIKQNSSQAWLSTSTVEKACGEHFDKENFRSCYCVGGIDLSMTTDLTSACLVIEKEGELYVISHFWMPTEKLEEAIARDGIPYELYIQKGFLSLSGDNFVQYSDVFDWFTDAVQNYELLPLQVGYDRYSSQYLIQDMRAYGFQCDDVFQGWNLTPVLIEMEGLLKDGKIHIGDNDLLKIHMLDSAIVSDERMQKIMLKKLRSTARIDGMAAFADAMTVRQKHFNTIGEQLKNS